MPFIPPLICSYRIRAASTSSILRDVIFVSRESMHSTRNNSNDRTYARLHCTLAQNNPKKNPPKCKERTLPFFQFKRIPALCSSISLSDWILFLIFPLSVLLWTHCCCWLLLFVSSIRFSNMRSMATITDANVCLHRATLYYFFVWAIRTKRMRRWKPIHDRIVIITLQGPKKRRTIEKKNVHIGYYCRLASTRKFGKCFPI